MDSHESITLKEWVEQGDVVGFSLSVIVDSCNITIVDAMLGPHTVRYDEKADHVHMGKMFASGRLQAWRLGKEYWADSKHTARWATFQLGPALLTITRKWPNKEKDHVETA